MSKGIRIYIPNQRLCYNVSVGLQILRIMRIRGWKFTGVGCEEGAMVVHAV